MAEIIYKGQMRCLREFLASKLPDVTCMDDDEVEDKALYMDYIILAENEENLLIVEDSAIEELLEDGRAAWLVR